MLRWRQVWIAQAATGEWVVVRRRIRAERDEVIYHEDWVERTAVLRMGGIKDRDGDKPGIDEDILSSVRTGR